MFELTVASLVVKAISKYYGLTKSDGAIEAAPSVPTGVEGTGRVEVIDFIETGREEEPIGQDTPRRCDNRKSKSETKFTIRASRTWRRQYTIQTERIRTEGATAAVGLNKVVTAKLQLTLQRVIHESFSETSESTRMFEQAFEVTVPPGVLQIVILDWKKIWQVGYVKLLVDGALVEVPFRVLVDIDYNQIHETVLWSVIGFWAHVSLLPSPDQGRSVKAVFECAFTSPDLS